MVTATTPAISTDLERLLLEVARQIQLSSSEQLAVREEFGKLAKHLTNGPLHVFVQACSPRDRFELARQLSRLAARTST